jgi:hypothetical protein
VEVRRDPPSPLRPPSGGPSSCQLSSSSARAACRICILRERVESSHPRRAPHVKPWPAGGARQRRPCSPLRNHLGRIRGWVAGAAATESGWGEGSGGDVGEESRGWRRGYRGGEQGWLGSEPRLGFGALGKAGGGYYAGVGWWEGCSQKRVGGVCKMTSTSNFGFFGYK